MRMAVAAFVALASVLPATAFAASAADPAVVELFTSQGCSSCPPANDSLRALADRPDVLALSFDVTYWDYLGWKDRFGSDAYTQRQRDYEGPLGERGPFTPQIVVDGQRDTVGNVKSEVEALIAQSHRHGGPAVRLMGSTLSIGAGSGSAEIWLVRYDPRIVMTPIQRGENGGATLAQRNVVRGLNDLGAWSGAARILALPPAPSGLKTAVLLQQGIGGPIIAAARD